MREGEISVIETNVADGSPDFPEQPTWRSAWYQTLDDVAAELGVNREQVRQIELRALRKCRAFCKARGVRLEDLLLN